MIVRDPHATIVSNRSIGYPPGASGRPVWRPNAAALAPLSGTNKVVPSMAHTSSPRQRATPAAGPRTRSNSSANGLTPIRRKAWESAELPGTLMDRPAPAANRARTCRYPDIGEHHTSLQHVHHHPRGQAPQALLSRSRSVDRRVDQVMRDYLRQLAEMPHSERIRRRSHRIGRDKLDRQRNSIWVAGRLARTSLHYREFRCSISRHADATLATPVTPLTARHWP